VGWHALLVKPCEAECYQYDHQLFKDPLDGGGTRSVMLAERILMQFMGQISHSDNSSKIGRSEKLVCGVLCISDCQLSWLFEAAPGAVCKNIPAWVIFLFMQLDQPLCSCVSGADGAPSLTAEHFAKSDSIIQARGKSERTFLGF
jgi:hypothetical protein